MMYVFRMLQRVPLIFWVIYSASVLLALSGAFIFMPKPMNVINSGCPQSRDPSVITKRSIDEITFITVPRPFNSKNQYTRNKLAIASWLSASPKTNVILFVNRSEFDTFGNLPDELDKLYGEGRVQYLGGIRSDLSGVPYIDDWFRQGIRASQSKYVCFINGDILISEKWLSRVKQVFAAMGDKNPVLIGQRIDFDLKQQEFDKLRFGDSDYLKQIDAMVDRSKHSDHSPYGIDSFTFQIESPPFDVEKIPPFVMGRYNWDNWLVGWLNKIAQTVTFNLSPPIYHVNHVRHAFDPNEPKVAVNHWLKKANGDYFGSNYDTKWEIKNEKVCQRRGGVQISLE